MKNSNDIIGNQTHDLPACSAVPQPTVPPRAPEIHTYMQRNKWARKHKFHFLEGNEDNLLLINCENKIHIKTFGVGRPCEHAIFNPLQKEIKQYQEKWLQHIQRMDTNRIPKQHLVSSLTDSDDTRCCINTV